MIYDVKLELTWLVHFPSPAEFDVIVEGAVGGCGVVFITDTREESY